MTPIEAEPTQIGVPCEPIAIVGMTCRTPGASSVHDFWDQLVASSHLIRSFSEGELLAAGVDAELLSNPNYVRAKPVLDDVELFDSEFFGINPAEADVMDPQQRIVLECGVDALQDAGLIPNGFDGAIGTFLGANMSRYLLNNLMPRSDMFGVGGIFQSVLTNDKDFASARLAYHLGLTGPAVTVQSACSSSLMAVGQACRSLQSGESDACIAGGISLFVPQKAGYLYFAGGLLSPDGVVRPYSAQAAGTVFGDGVGVVVLKRLSDAIADRDRIRATILGHATNNDGSQRTSFSAPGLQGQSQVVRKALRSAGVPARSISYVEGHGSGTPVGDAMEVASLTRAFASETSERGFCRLGSVKGNVGHLYSAAGIIGLIKTVLSLENELIPESLFCEESNPKIDFERTALRLVTKPTTWRRGDVPRRAGVSSFGLGGTNVHVILEEAPLCERRETVGSGPEILTLSSRLPEQLDRVGDRLVAAAQATPPPHLADLSFSLNTGRPGLKNRRAGVVDYGEAVQDALRRISRAKPRAAEPDRPVAFLFSGVGDQQVGSGERLYTREPVFRDAIDECSALLEPHLGARVADVLYRPSEPRSEMLDIHETWLAQPSVFALDYALAKLWISWGVVPDALMGHSIGEYVAACLAGVFPLESVTALVAKRALLINSLPRGAMIGVVATPERLEELDLRGATLAAINANRLCVLSAPGETVGDVEGALREAKLIFKRLATAQPFHSPLLRPIADDLQVLVEQACPAAPSLPYVSNLTGTWVSAEQATDPHFWVRHTCEPLRFAEGLELLGSDPTRLLLEAGPGVSLTSFAMEVLGLPRRAFASTSRACERPSDVTMLESLGALWCHGIEVDWQAHHRPRAGRRVPLPPLPWEKRRHWIDPPSSGTRVPGDRVSASRSAAPAKRPAGEWHHVPRWIQAGPLLAEAASPTAIAAQATPEYRREAWLLVWDDAGVAGSLATQLESAGHAVISVRPGGQFEAIGSDDFSLRIDERSDWEALLRHLASRGRLPGVLAHLPLVNDSGPIGFEHSTTQATGFFGLIALAQAYSETGFGMPASWLVVSAGMHDVLGGDGPHPWKATALGPCGVIPHEFEGVRCRSVDLPMPVPRESIETFARMLFVEAGTPQAAPAEPHESQREVAYRGKERWVKRLIPAKPGGEAPLRDEGVVLITGGLGGVGLAIAEHLFESRRAKLVLVSRSAEDRTSDGEDEIRRRFFALSERAEVEVVSADVTDINSMKLAVAKAIDRFGAIHAVVHAAGLPGAGLIQLKTRESASRVLSAKLEGTLVLHALFEEHELDFLALCSSELALAPAVGQVDYVAANCFLDAYAQYCSHREGPRTVAINWGPWRWDAWQASSAGGQGAADEIRAFRDEFGFTPEEGGRAFAEALALGVPQVAVSTLEPGAAVRWIAGIQRGNGASADRPAKAVHPRPELPSEYAEASSEEEHLLVGLWETALGVEGVGIDDHFLDLGGHSLLAAQILSSIRDEGRAELTISEFFEFPTIRRFAELLVAPGDGDAEDGLDELDLDTIDASRVDQLSEGAVERLLEGLLREGKQP